MSVLYAFLTRKHSTIQHGNTLFFSQNGSPPHCHLTLSLWAHATIMSTHFFSCESYRKITNANSSVCSRLSIPYTGFMWYNRWHLETILVASRNNCFDAQISQTHKELFCWGACHLSAENGERASLKSVTKNHPKSLKKKSQAQRTKDMTPACAFRWISL